MIVPGENVVAEWVSDDSTYRIYHDSCGSFKFKESIAWLNVNAQLKDKDNYLGRELQVIDMLEKMTGKGSQDSLWGGRPDIVLEKYDENGDIVSVLIGEVKYTDSKNYAIQGLKELLEYIALIKEGENYKLRYEDLFENIDAVKGCLFLDAIADWEIEEEKNISVVMFGEDSTTLKNVIEGVKRDSR